MFSSARLIIGLLAIAGYVANGKAQRFGNAKSAPSPETVHHHSSSLAGDRWLLD